MKAVKKLSDYLALPAWKLLYDKHVNKYLKNIIQETDTRPYKVYTALLTQSGESSTLYISSDDPSPLVVGVTYTITFNDGTGDFTNIGAPNNTVGTSFVATGTTPANWGTPGDVEVSYNSGAPVVTVLENTIGNIWFTYFQVGFYIINSNGLFTNGKSAWFNQGFPIEDRTNSMLLFPNGESEFFISTFSDNTSANGALYNPTTIEIRVYN